MAIFSIHTNTQYKIHLPSELIQFDKVIGMIIDKEKYHAHLNLLLVVLILKLKCMI